MTLLAFGDGESISEECYFGDTLYYILEGALYVSVGEDSRCLQTGDCLAVPAHTPHAVVAPDGCCRSRFHNDLGGITHGNSD